MGGAELVQLADDRRAAGVREAIVASFLAPSGVHTGRQWDALNGWPPLRWIGYRAVKGYDDKLAGQIRQRWMDNNERVYANVHKMVEKYNVEDITLEAGGGEYPAQDGFGWSNGVYPCMAAEER